MENITLPIGKSVYFNGKWYTVQECYRRKKYGDCSDCCDLDYDLCTRSDRKCILGNCGEARTDGKIVGFKEIDKPEIYKLNDPANPTYYGVGNGIECIDVMIQQYGEEEVQSFCKCNAFKYLFRCGHKNDPLEEIKKVQWYINKWIELQERKSK